MTISMHSWSSSLIQFLEHSNEDQLYATAMSAVVQRVARRRGTAKPIWIVDIGCGPGTKAAAICRKLVERSVRTKWTLIDIDQAWRPLISENMSSAGALDFQVHCPMDGVHWLRTLTDPPHIAQLIQVPYDDATACLALEIAVELANRGCLVAISAEDPRSDLSIIRRKLSLRGAHDIPRERLTWLTVALREAGLHVSSYPITHKYLAMPALTEEKWVFDLIFGGNELSNERSTAQTVINKCIETKRIPSLDAYILHIPDALLVVRQIHD